MAMSDSVKFRITGCRFGIAGISEVSGRVGFWPFSRPVSYHLGINCDAIEAGDEGVRIYRRGTLRAFSRYNPTLFTKLGAPKLNWAALLTPRHARGRLK
jgi:hypothetical protein